TSSLYRITESQCEPAGTVTVVLSPCEATGRPSTTAEPVNGTVIVPGTGVTIWAEKPFADRNHSKCRLPFGVGTSPFAHARPDGRGAATNDPKPGLAGRTPST